ncbi:MAG: hypothetical protein V3G42_11450 [Oscillospiraceae bacterium]
MEEQTEESEVSVPSGTSDSSESENKKIRLGKSPYAVTASRAFSTVRVSNSDWADDMTAHYYNLTTLLDFSVYQFSKEGYADTLKEFIEEEAEEYDAYEVSADADLNGTDAAYYYSVEEGKDGITFAVDIGEEYLEVYFRFADSSSKEEAWKIMQSFEKVENVTIPLGNYQIQIPEDFTLSSDEEDEITVYQSGNDSLSIYIRYDETSGETLSDFLNETGGSDIEPEAEVNGIPVAFYRSVEALDNAYHSVWNCVIPNRENSDGFITLSFRLDGITAEEEAQIILNTLSVSSDDVQIQ